MMTGCAERHIKNNTKLYLVLSFVMPFLLISAAFAAFSVYPFGDRQVLVADMYHQYYPFLRILQQKLQTGGSMLYSWQLGLGSGFLPVIAYYAASPLNLLTVFAPSAYLKEAMTLLLIIKIGCAGLFFAIYLKGVFKRNDFSIVAFSSCYALCSFILGYYWNIIWMDTAAILPLVVLGVYQLVKNGRFKLYTITLFLSVLMNYYIGFFVCFFTVIVFFAACIIEKLNIRTILRRLCEIIMCSVLSLGATAFLTVPAYIALKSASGMANRSFPANIQWYYTARELLSQIFNMFKPTYMTGMPNIYCGIVCVVLFMMFIASRKIPRREKLIAISVTAFFLISFNLNILDYVLHGFHFPNMLPARFSFLFCFAVITAAYRAFTLFETDGDRNDVFLAAWGMILLFIYCFRFDEIIIDRVTLLPIYLTLIVIGLFSMYFALLWAKSLHRWKKAATIAFYAVIMMEMSANVMFAVNTVGTTWRDGYPDKNDSVQAMLAELEAVDDEQGYRVEKADYYTVNDSALYGYRGVTQFSSTLNTNVAKFMEKLGMTRYVGNNCYYYRFGSPVANALFDIKYVLVDNEYSGALPFLSKFGQALEVDSYKSEAYLPLGFMIKDAACDSELDNLTPFDVQSTLFRDMAGISDNVFVTVAADRVYAENCKITEQIDTGYWFNCADDGQTGYIKAIYTMPENGMLYVYAKGMSGKRINVIYDGESKSFSIDNPCILAVGDYREGENVIISYPVEKDESGQYQIYAATLDYKAFYDGYGRLCRERLDIYKFSDTEIRGSINAAENGILYTSVPYEKGWALYVDGQKQEIKPFHNAFVCAEISAGRHEIMLRYSAEGYAAGLVISGISMLGIVLLFRFYKARRTADIIEPGRRIVCVRKSWDTERKCIQSAYEAVNFGEDGGESGE